MSSDREGASGGLMSSAGLTTYYDAESAGFSLDPKTVTLLLALSAVVIIMLNILV